MEYQLLKTVHILSSIILFGTGLGSAWYKWMSDRTGNPQQIAITNRHVVLADWLFTTPTVILQPLTGFLMLWMVQWPLSSGWIVASLVLYALAGICWLPVVWLQIKMRDIAEVALQQQVALPEEYRQLARIWFWLGVPAFSAMVVVVGLMVFKPSIAF